MGEPDNGTERHVTAAGQPNDMRDAVSVVKLHRLALPGLIAMALVVVATVLIWRTFAALSDPMLLRLWVAAMAVPPAATVCIIAIYRWHRPSDAQLVRILLPINRIVVQWLILCVIVSPWLLLPHADAELRGLMLMLYTFFMATGVMANTDSNGRTWVALFGLPASIGLFLLREGGTYALPTTILLALAGGTFFALERLVRKAETRALQAKWRSERDAKALNLALAAVAAERDAKTRFIASASHDLQQPLQAASLFFDAALDSPDARAREQAATGARRAFASTQALIGQMLDHLRLEAGAVSVRLETVALGSLLEAVAAEHEPGARAAGMRLTVVPTRLSATADPVLLTRTLGNLLANAVRHAQGERVLVGARRSGRDVTVWVIDDGNGIAAADAARLFEDYAQGQGAARGGFGLGLASVRRALALMHGAAGFEPRWTGGAAFWLRLPLAETGAAVAERLCAAA